MHLRQFLSAQLLLGYGLHSSQNWKKIYIYSEVSQMVTQRQWCGNGLVLQSWINSRVKSVAKFAGNLCSQRLETQQSSFTTLGTQLVISYFMSKYKMPV